MSSRSSGSTPSSSGQCQSSELKARRSVASSDRSARLISGTSGLMPNRSCERALEVVLGVLERRAERAAVLERMRHVAQVGLGRVVHQGGEHVLDITAPLLDELGHDHRVLGDRVEDPAVPAEPALVGERTRDVAGVELARVGVEGVDPAARDGLQVRAGTGRAVVGRGHGSHASHSYDAANVNCAGWGSGEPAARLVSGGCHGLPFPGGRFPGSPPLASRGGRLPLAPLPSRS